MSTEDMLDEYVRVTNCLNQFKHKLDNLKKKFEFKIENSNIEKHKEIINRFLDHIEHIKVNTRLSGKYKKYRQRQEELKALILYRDNDQSVELLHELKQKYYVLSKEKLVPITDEYEEKQRTNEVKCRFDDVVRELKSV
jgi:hypothetical protein